MVAIVTDIHYRMSLALIRDLGESGVTVICCESNRYCDKRSTPPLGALSRHCFRHVWLPEERYMDSLFDLCSEVGEEYRCRPALLPVGAATLAGVAAERKRFESVCGLLIPSQDQLALFNSKDRLADLARCHAVPTPESYVREDGESVDTFARRISYPCVIKPDCGEKLGLSAAQRYMFASTETEAVNAFSLYLQLSGEDPVVQRRLIGGGLGYSVLALDGKIVHSICHRRLREYPISGGPSSCCITEERNDLHQYVSTLVRETDFSGLAMFEFKEDKEGRPYLLEVNPRIWGTFPLSRVSNCNLSVVWCALAWNIGNPSDPVAVPDITLPNTRKMVFAATDIMAAIGYLRHGKVKKAVDAFCDFINPLVRDGVFEWTDAAPGAAYYRSLLAKEKRQ